MNPNKARPHHINSELFKATHFILVTPAEHIGQTKRALRDRFGEHRRAIQNKTTDAVLQQFNQKGHKLTDIELIPLELIYSKGESIHRARESFFYR